jgi:hypothetical protein
MPNHAASNVSRHVGFAPTGKVIDGERIFELRFNERA